MFDPKGTSVIGEVHVLWPLVLPNQAASRLTEMPAGPKEER